MNEVLITYLQIGEHYNDEGALGFAITLHWAAGAGIDYKMHFL